MRGSISTWRSRSSPRSRFGGLPGFVTLPGGRGAGEILQRGGRLQQLRRPAARDPQAGRPFRQLGERGHGGDPGAVLGQVGAQRFGQRPQHRSVQRAGEDAARSRAYAYLIPEPTHGPVQLRKVGELRHPAYLRSTR
jgi:hypothetical protein